MTDRMIQKGMILAAVAAAVSALPMVGCTNPEENFRPDNEPRSLHIVNDAQAANGARADGMLYPQHFDGNELNSLGWEKLNLMSKTNNKAPLVVYLDLPKNDPAGAARTNAVQTYLSSMGLKSFKIQMGPNPASHSMAQPGVARLGKTENPSMGSVEGGEGGSTMSAGAK